MDGQARIQVYLELKNLLKGGMASAKQQVNETVADMKEKFSHLKHGAVEAFEAMKEECPMLGKAIELATNPIVLMVAAVFALGEVMHKAMEINEQWETSMAKVKVMGGFYKEQMEELNPQLKHIASTNAAAYQDTPTAFKNFIGGGRSNEENIKNSDTALKASSAGFTSADTASKAGAEIMNATGISDAQVIYDKLFATMRAGKVDFEAVAATMPHLTTMSKDFGISIDQVGGALATLTAKGEDAGRASARLEATFRAIADPKHADAFEKMGVRIHDSHGAMRSLSDITEDFNKKMVGATDKQKETLLDFIGMDSRSGAAFLSLAQSTETLKANTEAVTNSQGNLSKAYEDSATSGRSWAIIGNMITGGLNELGEIINDLVVGPLGDWIVKNKGFLEDLGVVILSVAAVWGIYQVAVNTGAIVTGVFTAAQWLLNIALTANPIGIIVVAIGALIGGLILAYEKCEKFRAVLAGLMEVGKLFAEIYIGIGKTLIGVFTLDVGMIKEGATQAASAVATIMDGGIKKSFSKGYDKSMAESAAKEQAEAIEKAKEKSAKKETNLLAKPAGLKDPKMAALEKELEEKNKNKEAGMRGGSQTKVITINKLSMIDGNFVSSSPEFSGMGKKEIERFLEELFQRMMVNLGRSYS